MRKKPIGTDWNVALTKMRTQLSGLAPGDQLKELEKKINQLEFAISMRASFAVPRPQA